MRSGKPLTATLLLVFFLASYSYAFKFSDEEEKEARARAVRRETVRQLMSVPCQRSIRGKKVAVIIGEKHSGGGLSVNQSNYGVLFEIINARLRNVGLRTCTQEEITGQIARAEIEAYMRNDPDAALSAASRLGAQFIIRGIISSRSRVNPVLGINEVFVDMSFTLTQSSGRSIGGARASGDSYAGSDTLSVAASIVEDQADEVVAKLYHDFCTRGARVK